jgi:hypothetical protein
MSSACVMTTEQESPRHESKDDTGDSQIGEGVRVATGRELRAMCALILRADRDFPVVGLTCRKGEPRPALAPGRAREIIGPGIPLFVIAPGEVRAMKALLPERHDVFDGAARVWWPGVNKHSDPRDHPLFFDPAREYGERVLDELAREFHVRSLQLVDCTPEQQVVLQERLRIRTETRNRELAERVEELERQLALQEGRQAASELGPTEPDAQATGERERDGESENPVKALQILMIQKWTATLEDSFDWGEWPLLRYTFGEDFLDRLVDRADLDDVAWACAMVACRLAEEFKELMVERRVSRPDCRQLTRADGAMGWRCTLTRKTTTAYLDFWTCPSGSIEFALFTNHPSED